MDSIITKKTFLKVFFCLFFNVLVRFKKKKQKQNMVWIKPLRFWAKVGIIFNLVITDKILRRTRNIQCKSHRL